MDPRFKAFDDALAETIRVKRSLSPELKQKMLHVVDAIITAQQADKQVLIFGNGGSAADAQHFAGELVGRFLQERPPLNAHALTTDTSTLTCLINDYPPDQLFARQVTAHARSGDVVIGISTSGNSPNIIAGLLAAQDKGALTVGLTGEGGGQMADHCDVLLDVPSRATPRIQEAHIFLIHMMCEFVEAAFV